LSLLAVKTMPQGAFHLQFRPTLRAATAWCPATWPSLVHNCVKHNKTVKEAMELQVAGGGGSKRKYALADIKADIASKRLFVRKPPPNWGSSSTQPPRKEGTPPPPPTHPSHPALTPTLALTPMGSAIRRRQQQQQQQHQPTALTAPAGTTALLGRWLKTAGA
jgi:hypothetical protein